MPLDDAWATELARMGTLCRGWNGYTAPAPAAEAIETARRFVDDLCRDQFPPSRVAPSAVGGVGVTLRAGGRFAYVEFLNSGATCMLLSDGQAEPTTRSLANGAGAFALLIGEIRCYLGQLGAV